MPHLKMVLKIKLNKRGKVCQLTLPHIQVGPIADNNGQIIGYLATWGVDDEISLT